MTVAYQKDPESRQGDIDVRSNNTNFVLSPSQMETLKSWFQDAVTETLTENDGYRIVDTPGPNVLRVSTDLIDLIVRVPIDRRGDAGRPGRRFVDSYGEVTLVVEIRDSESGEILGRAADRVDPTGGPTTELVEVSPTLVRSDTQSLFRYWAGVMRGRLDALREVDGATGQ